MLKFSEEVRRITLAYYGFSVMKAVSGELTNQNVDDKVISRQRVDAASH